MQLEVRVGAIAKKFRSTRSEVGEPGDELLTRQGRRSMEANFRGLIEDAQLSFSFPSTADAREECNLLAIWKPLKVKEVKSELRRRAQQNDEP
jgi:hypothetical protein